jgi:hypothetical protein
VLVCDVLRNMLATLPPIDKPTSVKLTEQWPPGVVGFHRNDTGLHCKNSNAVVMMLKIDVLTITLHSSAMCHFRTTMRNKNRAIAALDTAMPI